jgi:hypothetical protein
VAEVSVVAADFQAADLVAAEEAVGDVISSLIQLLSYQHKIVMSPTGSKVHKERFLSHRAHRAFSVNSAFSVRVFPVS